MAVAAANLAQLRTDLGEQAHLMQYAPLDEVETKPYDEPTAVSFAILFGYIQDQYTGMEHAVWIHLYPARRTGGYPEVQFHAYEDGEPHAKYDAEVICRAATGFRAAFTLPGRWSKAKLVALAKYYFLEKLVEMRCDEEKMSFGMPITKSFKSDLMTVCREFGEGRNPHTSHTASPRPVSAKRMGKIHDSQSSSLSDKPPGLLDNEVSEDSEDRDVTDNGDTRSDQAISDGQVDKGLHITSAKSVQNEVIKTLAAINDEEEEIMTRATEIEEGLASLEVQRMDNEERRKRVEKLKEDTFDGLTAVDAYKLGMEVERIQADKRRRLL